MSRMRAVDAAVRVLEKEGVTCAFGVPGAAINPLYSALKAKGTIRHILARHVESASHMADGYTRTKPGSIGVCIGTSGPAGTDFVLGIGNRWANRHTGSIETYTKGRTFVHVDIEPTQIGRVFNPDLGIVSDAKVALELFCDVAAEWKASGKLQDRSAWVRECVHRKGHMLRKLHFDQVPLKPQRVYEEMNSHLDRDTCYVTTIGLSQIAGAQFLHVYNHRNWINCGQTGPLGWTLPAALGVRAADPNRRIVALSGDYDFQFMIEELAVGAQHKLPYLHVVVNNSYLGLIRQPQRGFEMDFEVSLAFENINAKDDSNAVPGYGVDHATVAEGPGCKAVRVRSPNEFKEAFAKAEALMREHQVPVVLEFIVERVTNISMGTEISSVNEFEEILCLDPSLTLESGWGSMADQAAEPSLQSLAQGNASEK